MGYYAGEGEVDLGDAVEEGVVVGDLDVAAVIGRAGSS